MIYSIKFLISVLLLSPALLSAEITSIDCGNSELYDSCIDKKTKKKVYFSITSDSHYWVKVPFSCYQCSNDNTFVLKMICGGKFSKEDCRCSYNMSSFSSTPGRVTPPSDVTPPMPCY